MIINKRKKALVLRLRDPERVTAVIPSAKKFTYRGKEYVAVRHGPDETKVLRNLGISAPSPILHHYTWPGRYKPFEAQREAAAFLSLENRAFNLSDLGTGKTLATLWAYDFLRSRGVVKKALVITPLSTLERVWGDEVFQHFNHLNVAVLHGAREHRLKLLEEDADLYLINHDGIKVSGFVEALQNRPDIDLVIIDEVAQMARNAGTERFRALMMLCNRQVPRKVWGLTGTPTPNAPTDAWAQCRLLVPERVPVYFNRFKDMVMKQVNQFLWLPRVNATEVVHEAMQPAIRFKRDECVDLPPCMYETREAPLTKDQSRAYKDMLDRLCIEAKCGKITAANEAVKAQKLIQIACGVVYDGNGGEAVLDAGPRLDVVTEIVESAGAKVIVFVPFVAVIDHVLQHIRDAGFTAEAIHGGVSKGDRDRIFSDFMRASNPHVIEIGRASCRERV